MNIIIAGGRNFNDFKKMLEAFEFTIQEHDIYETEIIIFSGHCPTGADVLGEILANMRGYKICLFIADWNKNGKAAGPIRNEQMAKEADRALIFWDGKSKGTLNMINNCIKYKVPHTIVEY